MKMHGLESEKVAQQSYSRIAAKYYSAANPTTRIFDLVISRYLSRHPPELIRNGTYAEIGAGKTKLADFLGSSDSQVVLLDLCKSMVAYSRPMVNDCVHLTVGSASRLPFRETSLSGVYSFLGDAFTTKEYFREVLRVLQNAAGLLHVTPNAIWAKALRKRLGIPLYCTVFPDDGGTVLAPSIVMEDTDLRNTVLELGFSECRIEDLFVPNDVTLGKLPPHIIIPSKELHESPYEIPILTLLKATKRA